MSKLIWDLRMTEWVSITNTPNSWKQTYLHLKRFVSFFSMHIYLFVLFRISDEAHLTWWGPSSLLRILVPKWLCSGDTLTDALEAIFSWLCEYPLARWGEYTKPTITGYAEKGRPLLPAPTLPSANSFHPFLLFSHVFPSITLNRMLLLLFLHFQHRLQFYYCWIYIMKMQDLAVLHDHTIITWTCFPFSYLALKCWTLCVCVCVCVCDSLFLHIQGWMGLEI